MTSKNDNVARKSNQTKLSFLQLTAHGLQRKCTCVFFKQVGPFIRTRSDSACFADQYNQYKCKDALITCAPIGYVSGH